MLYSQLRSFHAVAKEGGFTAAAVAIHIGQSTISTQIKALEDKYGVTLFHRTGRKIQITDCGMALFKISQRIFQLEEEAQDLLNHYGGILKGDLRIGAVGPYHATDILAMFNKKHPGINLTVKLGNSMEMVDLLISYSVDVAVLEPGHLCPPFQSTPDRCVC